jgi:hypothetical protein
MGTDVVNLCLMAVIALAGFALASRQMGRGRGYPRGDGGTTGGGRTPGDGGRRGGAGGGYPGRQGGQLFPDRGDSQPASPPSAPRPTSDARPNSGGSVFPQSNDTRRSSGLDSDADNGYGGRRGGSLFPPKDGN